MVSKIDHLGQHEFMAPEIINECLQLCTINVRVMRKNALVVRLADNAWFPLDHNGIVKSCDESFSSLHEGE